jgi:transcriptional regulator with XRE-family HTH domain
MNEQHVALYREIGRLVRERRKFMALTQSQLASRVGVSRPSIVNIEQGRQSMLVHHLYDIAGALLTSPAALAPAPSRIPRDWIVLRGVYDADKTPCAEEVDAAS